jgi:hypothetical protein
VLRVNGGGEGGELIRAHTRHVTDRHGKQQRGCNAHSCMYTVAGMQAPLDRNTAAQFSARWVAGGR